MAIKLLTNSAEIDNEDKRRSTSDPASTESVIRWQGWRWWAVRDDDANDDIDDDDNEKREKEDEG